MQLSDKERAEEAKWQLDQDTLFRIRNRRNKLLGLWAAELMGHAGAEAESYAQAVVKADFEKDGDDDVVEKVAADLKEAGKGDAALVRGKLDGLMGEARKQIMEG